MTEFKLDEFNEGHYVEVKATSQELVSITEYHSPFQVHLTGVQSLHVKAFGMFRRLLTRSAKLRTSVLCCTQMMPQSMARSCV